MFSMHSLRQVAAALTFAAITFISAGCSKDSVMAPELPNNEPPAPIAAIESVVLDRSSAEIVVGEDLRLAVTVNATGDINRSVNFTSSDEAVATVAGDGVVKAVKIGTATITAASNAAPDMKASLEIQVKEKPPTPIIFGVQLDRTSASLFDDEKLQITATVTASGDIDRSVRFASSDARVATIDANGLVTAVGQGSARIFAASNADPTKTAGMDLTIVIRPAVTDVELNHASGWVRERGTFQLQATVTGRGDYSRTVRFTSSNTNVATVDAGGLVTGVRNGNATITATSVTDGSKSAAFEIDVLHPQYGKTTSLRSFNFPDRFVRHMNSLGELTTLSSDLDFKDATFVIRAGLGRASGVSFESVNYPGYFLSLDGSRLKLVKRQDNATYNGDATFFVKPGLADSRAISLESMSRPGSYLRHSYFHMVATNGSTDASATIFRQDATFNLVAR